MTNVNAMFSLIHVDEKPYLQDPIYQDMYHSATADYPETISVERFLRLVTAGFPFLAAWLRPDYSRDKDEKRGDRFIAQFMYVLDFDNKDEILALDEALRIAVQQDLFEPLFYYTTFSHTEECPRYRIGFRTEYPLMTRDEHRDNYKLLNSFFGDRADKQCLHPERLFQGTHRNAQCGVFFNWERK